MLVYYFILAGSYQLYLNTDCFAHMSIYAVIMFFGFVHFNVAQLLRIFLFCRLFIIDKQLSSHCSLKNSNRLRWFMIRWSPNLPDLDCCISGLESKEYFGIDSSCRFLFAVAF